MSIGRFTFFIHVFVLLFIYAGKSQKQLTIKDIYNSAELRDESLQDIHWKEDGRYLIYRKYTKFGILPDIYQFDLKTKEESVFISGKDIIDPEGNSIFYPWNVIYSPNGKYLLFTDKLPARKTKSGGNFHLYNIKTKKLSRLTKINDNQLNVHFSHDSEKIAFVRNNNLFLMNLQSKKEKQLTFDGTELILNGHFDWVYEEEFDIIEGWQWSPDGKYIAFWQIDEREVPEFKIPLYDKLYPEFITIRYPKAGQTNSKVRIGIVHIENGNNIWFQFNDYDFYVPRIQWLPDSKQLAIVNLNRLQNHIEIYLGDIDTGKIKKVFDEQNDYWLEIRDDLKFLKNSSQFVWTSENSGFRHIYLNDYETGNNKQITKGDWQIRDVKAVDELNAKIYFTATKSSELENHLYRIDFDGNNLSQLSKEKGWHNVTFSPDSKYYLDKYSNANIPTKSIIFESGGNYISTLAENEMAVLKEFDFSEPEFFKIPLNEKEQLNGWILKPRDFDPKKEYPLLICSYGGPGSQKVKNEWGSVPYWCRLLSQNDVIIACVDNRGTEGRGADFKKYVYKKLGHLDVQDQIDAARYLGSLEYIDENKIGMYGWSYGGYMSLMCLLQGNDVFKLAVSVAPVTDWRYYDSIYTECFMQTPELNPQGYELGSVMNYVELLKGKLLLIHGMADDNVHFQNSAELTKELIRQNKQFDMMFYPGYKHSITGKKEHVFKKITDYILENL